MSKLTASAASTLASALVLAVSTGLASPAGAMDRFEPDGSYDPGVPTPASALGFEIGDRPVRHRAVVDYFTQLAATSPHVRLERYASSHEGRELIYLLVTSSTNLARIDAIQESVRRIADPRTGIDDELLQTTPAIAYLAYSIHGDELSGADAAVRLAYELAAGRSDDTARLRDELVVLIDPMENPDGRERFLSMTAAFSGAIANPDPDALAHTAFWPWGRANHYLFDLNRDWFALVHPESRGRADILRTWRPQLVVDSHEMGAQSTYLFSPPRAPFNPNLPTSTRDWWQRFASDQMAAFDRHGWSYFTREWNEEFFPGYGSSLALYAGAVGILYEQAGTDGGPIRKRHGGTLTYEDAVRHQYVSSLANLRSTANNRVELLTSYRAARAEAIARGRKAPARAYYFAPSPDPARAHRLASRLARLGIEVETLDAAATLKTARDFWSDGASPIELPAGSFRVRTDQPDGLVARAILEPHTPMADFVFAEEREHIERQKGSRVYDTTAWSPLLASGLDGWWSSRLDKLDWRTIEKPHVEPPKGRVDSLLESKARPRYGWLFDGTTDGALVLAARLAAAGFKVQLGERPFELDGRSYSRGSFLLRTEENPASPATLIRQLAPALGVRVHAIDTARAERGPELGGGYWTLLYEARVAVLAGNPLDFTSVGAAWHLLDNEHRLRVSLLDIGRVAKTDLDRYNVVVVPNVWGGSSAAQRALGEAGVKALGEWVQRGGTLVGIGSAARFAADAELELSSVRPRSQVLESFVAPRFGLDDAAIRSLELLQATGLDRTGEAAGRAGPVSESEWPAELGIPGVGSPVLGPGTWALLGGTGDTLRARALVALEPADTTDLTDDEKKRQRERADERLRRFLPSGAILRADLDTEHWLAFGAGSRVAVMVRGGDSLIARDPVRTIGRFARPDELHLGGLLWPEAAGHIAMTAFVTRESKGRGQIILFAQDPNFRGYFWGTERLFLNAVLLGPGVGTDHTIPW